MWRAETAAGEPVVIKLLDGTVGRVDGHDLSTFLLKPRQIARVHTDLPALSPHYVRVTKEWRGADWAAYAMPYLAGRPVSEPLRFTDPDIPGFLVSLRRVLGVLTEHGYSARDKRADPGHFRACYVDRVRRRLPLLMKHLDPALFSGHGVVVNGRRRPPVTHLLDRLADRAGTLRPALLHYPVHGDLNLGNLLMRPGTGGFALLDPRGTLELWDPVYDMAKILFSLVVYEPGMEGGFTVTRSTDLDGMPRFHVALRRPLPSYFAAALRLRDVLGSLPFFERLSRLDPDWPRRLVFAHAAHCLAEAACRLSDRRPRELGSSRGFSACLELASGLFLTGLVLLDEALAADGDDRLCRDDITEITCPSRVPCRPS